MTNILVTGGAGYIGSHTCKALFEAGFVPVVYDNLSTGHAYAVKWGPFIEADLNDSQKLNETLQLFKPKAVIHFAANAIVSESMLDPGKYYRNNVGSTVALLEAMRAHGIKKLVFSSTCATYGNPTSYPITEECPQLPINPYGRSKLMVEQIIRDFSYAYGLKAVILRYFNAAGADRDAEIGENHIPETHLIPGIIETYLGLRKEIVVYGSDFPTKDGSAIRDYIHVHDLSRAHVAALRVDENIALNLGTGRGYSVFEIIRAIETLSSCKVPVRIEAKRAGEPPILTADYSKAQATLQWKPEMSDIKTILETALRWHKKERVPCCLSH